jgi:hypothetical protein
MRNAALQHLGPEEQPNKGLELTALRAAANSMALGSQALS